MTFFPEDRLPSSGETGETNGFRLLGRTAIAAMYLTASLAASMATSHAALIEIPALNQKDRAKVHAAPTLSYWQFNSRGLHEGTYGLRPVIDRGTYRTSHLEIGLIPGANSRARLLAVDNGRALAASDPYAAIDAPYGAIDNSAPAGDPDPEFWTILIVAAGLVGYQMRRKSRSGAIRIRPLQAAWRRSGN